MKQPNLPRREFLQTLGLSTAAAALAGSGMRTVGAEAKGKLHLATNVYPWLVFYQRDKKDFNVNLEAGLKEIAGCQLDGFEPIIERPQQIGQLMPLLKQNGLELRSFYVNSTLHEKDKVAESLTSILAIAEEARRAGTRIIVTNPSPIRWGGPEDKNDTQLKIQAEALNQLGRKLAGMGLTLAYHNHDPELRQAAREFHHMMLGTDPQYVTLCLDAHWIYRGSGNSAVALFDVLKLYGSRITELHLRQSVKGTWTETFGEGDIDYVALAEQLRALKLKPLLVLEQAVESGSPKAMSAAEAHRVGAVYARKIFADFAA